MEDESARERNDRMRSVPLCGASRSFQISYERLALTGRKGKLEVFDFLDNFFFKFAVENGLQH